MKRVATILAVETFYSLTNELLRRSYATLRARLRAYAPRGAVNYLRHSYAQFILSKPFILRLCNGSLRRLAALRIISQRFGGIVGEPRALATQQRDVAAVRPAFHSIHDIGE